MSLFHAVVWIDHQQADVVQFDAEQARPLHIKAHHHPTAQHGSAVRTVHEYFGEVCDALEGITEVLVTGPHTGLADFRHYVEKHRPQRVRQVVGYEVADHPSEKQLVALARAYFLKYDRMAGTPTPT